MTNEELIAENASLKDEVAKLRQRLVIRENLRERIAQLNTQLAIARAGSSHTVWDRVYYDPRLKEK